LDQVPKIACFKGLACTHIATSGRSSFVWLDSEGAESISGAFVSRELTVAAEKAVKDKLVAGKASFDQANAAKGSPTVVPPPSKAGEKPTTSLATMTEEAVMAALKERKAVREQDRIKAAITNASTVAAIKQLPLHSLVADNFRNEEALVIGSCRLKCPAESITEQKNGSVEQIHPTDQLCITAPFYKDGKKGCPFGLLGLAPGSELPPVHKAMCRRAWHSDKKNGGNKLSKKDRALWHEARAKANSENAHFAAAMCALAAGDIREELTEAERIAFTSVNPPVNVLTEMRQRVSDALAIVDCKRFTNVYRAFQWHGIRACWEREEEAEREEAEQKALCEKEQDSGACQSFAILVNQAGHVWISSLPNLSLLPDKLGVASARVMASGRSAPPVNWPSPPKVGQDSKASNKRESVAADEAAVAEAASRAAADKPAAEKAVADEATIAEAAAGTVTAVVATDVAAHIAADAAERTERAERITTSPLGALANAIADGIAKRAQAQEHVEAGVPTRVEAEGEAEAEPGAEAVEKVAAKIVEEREGTPASLCEQASEHPHVDHDQTAICNLGRGAGVGFVTPFSLALADEVLSHLER
jgi:hypothetical protein